MILPSIEDANGIAIQEAMAVGLVPVCLDWGGPQLLIDDGVSGYLVSADRADEIATRMACCLNLLVRDLNLATELSTNAKARASRWNWTQLAGDWVHCYLTLVEPAREAVEIDALTLVSTDDGTSSPIRTA
jgi:glycosyltransferase involved in cell wall biosynthesis